MSYSSPSTKRGVRHTLGTGNSQVDAEPSAAVTRAVMHALCEEAPARRDALVQVRSV